jgi:deoxyribonuclease V
VDHCWWMRHPGAGAARFCAAVDVHYLSVSEPCTRAPSTRAKAAVVTAADPTFDVVLLERTMLVADVPPYQPGQFYLRELPPVRAVLATLGKVLLSLIVVDGYVELDPDGRPGLGALVHDEFGVPVIGVAKSAFRSATQAIPVLRGSSAKPLFVTAAGMPGAAAAELVRAMAGPFRLPDALRRVDALARGA